MADADPRAQVALGGRVLHEAGLADLVWGHVSLRDSQGRGVWMKASGLGFEEVTVADVLLVGWDGEVVEGAGPRHREYPIHTEIIRARPDVGSVVHVHPPHAIALAASGRPLQAFSHAAGFLGEGARRYADAPGLVDTQASGAALAAAMRRDPAILLTGHGVVTVGTSVPIAVMRAVMLERACELQLLAEGFGGVGAPFGRAEAAHAYAHTLTDDFLLGAWEYLVRRVGAA